MSIAEPDLQALDEGVELVERGRVGGDVGVVGVAGGRVQLQGGEEAQVLGEARPGRVQQGVERDEAAGAICAQQEGAEVGVGVREL